jgi:tRNA uridine 5-carboxymethylaminomethyl modification enzyme
LIDAGVAISQDGSKRTAFEALAIEAVTWDALLQIAPELSEIDEKTRVQLGKDALYANYIERQKKDIEALRRDEAQVIPSNFDFSEIEGLSNELKLKLSRSQPANISQASRIDGMTPSALLLILSRIRSLTPRERAAG